jgi:nicotinate-nucleotide adenylyltransferase
MAAHPRIDISGAEAIFRTRYTADLIQILRRHSPATRFVWVMGGDNLGQFHLWERWREIAGAVAIAVINRPGHLATPLAAPTAQSLGKYRIDEADAVMLAELQPPAWVYLTGPRTAASSSALRAGGEAS